MNKQLPNPEEYLNTLLRPGEEILWTGRIEAAHCTHRHRLRSSLLLLVFIIPCLATIGFFFYGIYGRLPEQFALLPHPEWSVDYAFAVLFSILIPMALIFFILIAYVILTLAFNGVCSILYHESDQARIRYVLTNRRIIKIFCSRFNLTLTYERNYSHLHKLRHVRLGTDTRTGIPYAAFRYRKDQLELTGLGKTDENALTHTLNTLHIAVIRPHS